MNKDITNNIEFLEGWLYLLESGASAEVKFEFCRNHGFVSETHLSLWMDIHDEYQAMQNDLDLMKSCHNLTDASIMLLEQGVSYKKELARAMKNPDFYIKNMIILGKEDISPYGEDLLKKYMEER